MSEKLTAEDFVKDTGEARKKVDALAQSNKSKTENLSKEGVDLGPGVIALWKIDALIDTIMTTPESRLIFDYNFEVTRQSFLNNLLKEIRQMRLVEGVQQAKSKLTLPGR